MFRASNTYDLKVFGCLGYFPSWTCLGRDFCVLPLGGFEFHVLISMIMNCENDRDRPKDMFCSRSSMKVKGCRRCFRPPKTLWIPFTFSCSLCRKFLSRNPLATRMIHCFHFVVAPSQRSLLSPLYFLQKVNHGLNMFWWMKHPFSHSTWVVFFIIFIHLGSDL